MKIVLNVQCWILLQFMWPCLFDDKCLSGNKCLLSLALSALPLQCWAPNLPFYLSEGVRGSYQQQSSTNQRDLLSGDWIWPDHTTVWPLEFLQRLPQFLPFPQRLPLSWSRGTWRLLIGGHWVILRWGWEPRGCYCCGKSLPLVDPALMSDIPGRADPAQVDISYYCEE